VPARKVADDPIRLIDADRQEPLELTALLIENADSCVPRVSKLTCRVEDPLQDGLKVEFRDQATANFDQALKPLFASIRRPSDAWIGVAHCPTESPRQTRPCERPFGGSAIHQSASADVTAGHSSPPDEPWLRSSQLAFGVLGP